MLRTIYTTKNPKILVITPLKPGDVISKVTKTSIKKNKTPFNWVSYEGNGNIPINTQNAIDVTKNIPEYIIKIDNDINADKGMLDDMYEVLKNTDEKIAYCYPPFKYILSDKREISFSGDFNKRRLLQSNYITSNSLIKYNKLKQIDGFVCNEKYERLLDYCLWLKFLRFGYEGVQCNKGFITPLNENNVSARGQEDYQDKMNKVRQDFILPYF